ncbi:oligosaccharide flippase family protein [candidate division KSB1 bacterium]
MIRIVPGADEEKKVPIYKTLLLFEVLISLAFIAAIILFKADKYFCSLVNISEFIPALRLAFIVIVMQIVAMGFCRFYSSIKEIEFSNFIGFFNSGFWILILLGLWAVGVKITIPLFFLAWICGSCITIIVGLRKIGVGHFITSELDTSLFKKALLFGAPLILSCIGYDLVSSSSSFILSYYHTSSATGIYFMAYRPLKVVYEFVTVVGTTVFIPYIIEAHNNSDIEKKHYYMSIMTKYTFIAAVPFIIGLLIGREDIVLFVSKPEYIDAAGIIPFVAIIPLLYVFMYPPHYELYLRNKTFFIGSVYFIGALITVGLNILFIPKYSYYAAALSTVVSLMIVGIVFYLKAFNTLRLRWIFIKAGRIIFVAIISGIISYYLYSLLDTFSVTFVRLSLLGIIILFFYTIGLYVFHVFEKKETDILKQFTNKIFSVR